MLELTPNFFMPAAKDTVLLAGGFQVGAPEQATLTFYYADKEVTSAQLLALNATPVEIVAAPPSGYFIAPEDLVFYKPAGTAYAGIAAGEDLSVKYTNAAGLELAGVEATGFLDQATAQVRHCRAYRAASSVSGVTPVNGALVLHMLVGEITTGDTVLRVRTFFRVLPLSLL